MIWFYVNDKYEHNINHTPINIEKQFLTQFCCILELRRPPTVIVVQTQTVTIRFASKNSLFLYHWFQDLILCDQGYGSLKEVYFIFVAEKHYLQVVQREILIYSCIFISTNNDPTGKQLLAHQTIKLVFKEVLNLYLRE